jgi:hypothetical protein
MMPVHLGGFEKARRLENAVAGMIREGAGPMTSTVPGVQCGWRKRSLAVLRNKAALGLREIRYQTTLIGAKLLLWE